MVSRIGFGRRASRHIGERGPPGKPPPGGFFRGTRKSPRSGVGGWAAGMRQHRGYLRYELSAPRAARAAVLSLPMAEGVVLRTTPREQHHVRAATDAPCGAPPTHKVVPTGALFFARAGVIRSAI
jgi:hypothetical protein